MPLQTNNQHILSGGSMIATTIPVPMGSPWHNLVYFPIFNRFI